MRFQVSLLVVTALLALIRAFDKFHYKCGIRVPGGKGRIGFGQPVNGSQWLAKLEKEGSDGKTSICTGSLIDQNWVMTAAHCVHDAKAVTVTLGKEEFTEKVEPANIFSHPCYDDAILSYHDIALIWLTETPDLKRDTIGSICLPMTDVLLREEPYKNCYAEGWGQTETGKTPEVALESKAFILSGKHCLGGQTTHCADPRYIFCAKQYKRDTGPCIEDTGGPLTCLAEDTHWEASGILRSRRTCGDPRSVTEYTSIFPHLPWLKRTMKTKSRGPYECFQRNENICKVSTARIHGVLEENEMYCFNRYTANISYVFRIKNSNDFIVTFADRHMFIVPSVDPGDETHFWSSHSVRHGWLRFLSRTDVEEWSGYKAGGRYPWRIVVRDKPNGDFMGYSQVMVGCPQPLCAVPRISAIFYRFGILHVVVGHHYWTLPNNLITKRQPQASDLSPSTVVSLPSDISLLFQDMHYVILQNDEELSSGFIRGPEPTNPFPANFPLGLDAIVHLYSKKCGSVLYAFKGPLYWKLGYSIQKKKDGKFSTKKPVVKIFMDKRYPKHVRDLNPQLVGIDEAFLYMSTSELLIFKRFYVARISLDPKKSFEANLRAADKVHWKFIHSDFLGCDDRIYKNMRREWNTYWNDFPTIQKSYFQNTTILEVAATEPSTGSYYILIPILAVALLVMVVICLSFFGFVFWQRSKAKSSKEKKGEETGEKKEETKAETEPGIEMTSRPAAPGEA